MFLKRTKRKIKQLLFTGYLNTTVKHFDIMPIYHSQLFNLFTLPVSLLPHLRDFLFESWSLFQYRALRAVVSPGRTRLAKPLLAGYYITANGRGHAQMLGILGKKGFWKKKKRMHQRSSYDENKNLEFILKMPILPGCALEIVPFLSTVPCGRTYTGYSTVALHTLSFASLGKILLRSSLSLLRIPPGRTKTSNRKIKCLCVWAASQIVLNINSWSP